MIFHSDLIAGNCGDILRLSYKKRSFQNLRLLTKMTGSSISIPSTYILFLTEMQKRQTL
jgi:hypothetical protein